MQTDTDSQILWQSCCIKCDKQVVQYVTKTFFAVCILGFTCIQIANNTDPCNPLLTWYTSLVGMIAGSYIEQSTKMDR